MLDAERSFRRIKGHKQMSPQFAVSGEFRGVAARRGVDALHRYAHPETARSTESVGAAAESSPWIVTHLPRDSGSYAGALRGGFETRSISGYTQNSATSGYAPTPATSGYIPAHAISGCWRGEHSGQGVRRGENLHVAPCLTVGWSSRVQAGLLTGRGGGTRCGCDGHRNGPGCQQRYVVVHPRSHDRLLRIPASDVAPTCWSAGCRWCWSGAACLSGRGEMV